MSFNILPMLLSLIIAVSAVSMPIAVPQSDEAVATETEERGEVQPASGYVLLTLQSGSYWLALPEEGELEIPIRQYREDGTEEVNTLLLTHDGVGMASSTCENQDCVEQGFVSLEDRDHRILGNMILCLPNSVAVELYTPDEVVAMYAAQVHE